MIYIIHGEDTISSRNHLSNLKRQYGYSAYLDGQKLTLQEFYEVAANQPLFSEKTLLIVENYTGEEKIFAIDTPHDLAFWWPKTLTKLPSVGKVFHFKERVKAGGIFRFADSVAQRQERSALLFLNNLLEDGVPPEKIISILTRQLKLLAQALKGDVDKVSSSEFVRKKVLEQSHNWTLKKIKEGFLLLFQVDLRIKKGMIKQDAGLTFLTSRLCR